MNTTLASIKQRRIDVATMLLEQLECNHPKACMRNDNGCARWQCVRCGAVFGSVEPDEVGGLDPVDPNISLNWKMTVNELKPELIEGLRRAERTSRKWLYKAYLLTPEWAEKRGLVMGRCNYICEGCGKRRAVHVHHKTYEHLGDEFLFELIGLCAICHERLHHIGETR